MNHKQDDPVKVYMQTESLCYVNLERGTYKIDDKEVILEEWRNSVIVDHNAEILKMTKWNDLAGYENEDKKFITKENYLRNIAQIGYKNFDPEEECNPNSLEIEYEYKKFCREWPKAVYNHYENYEKVEVEIIQKPEPFNDFIIPMRKVSGDLKDTLYIYQRNIHAVAKVSQMLEQYGLKKYENKCVKEGFYFIEKDGVEYSKFNTCGSGEYITIKIPYLESLKKIKSSKGELPELVKNYNEIDLLIEQNIDAYFNKPTIPKLQKEIEELKEKIRKYENEK